MSRFAVLAAALALPLAASAGPLQTLDFTPVTAGKAQNARVHLVNLTPVGAESPPDPCKGTVAFLNPLGAVVGKIGSFTLPAGRSLAYAAPVQASVRALRPHFTFQAPAPGATPPDPCAQAHGLVEVFDTADSTTKFLSPGEIRGFNPQPDPPG